MTENLLKINIGSGFENVSNFINIDISSHCNPDYVLDIEKDTLPFKDNSVDEVICHHILEHLGDGFFHCMKEIYRVCVNNSIIHVRVPHPRHDTFLIDPTHKRPIYPDTLAMFSQQRNKSDIDANGRETPLGLMYGINFEVVSIDYVLNPFFQELFQSLSNEQCEMIVQTQNNVVQEILMKLMVIK